MSWHSCKQPVHACHCILSEICASVPLGYITFSFGNKRLTNEINQNVFVVSIWIRLEQCGEMQLVWLKSGKSLAILWLHWFWHLQSGNGQRKTCLFWSSKVFRVVCVSIGKINHGKVKVWKYKKSCVCFSTVY